jgi:hypothetical protein
MHSEVKQALIPLGSTKVQGFMMPDGSYRIRQSAVATLIGQDESDVYRFFQSGDSPAVQAQNYPPECIEISDSEQPIAPQRITVLQLPAATAYWLWQTGQGNPKAYSLMIDVLLDNPNLQNS